MASSLVTLTITVLLVTINVISSAGATGSGVTNDIGGGGGGGGGGSSTNEIVGGGSDDLDNEMAGNNGTTSGFSPEFT
jgi:hypothetical protein